MVCWLLMDSILPTLGLSLHYLLMTLSLLCAAGLTIGSSWTQSCPPPLDWVYCTCSWLCPFYVLQGWWLAPHGLNPAHPWAESTLPTHNSVPFMCCRVDGWLLMDSILPTLGLSLLYLLMNLSLLCAAGLTVGSSWTQFCPPLGWVYPTCSWLCPFYVLQGWRLAPHGLNPAHTWAESTLPAHDSDPVYVLQGWRLAPHGLNPAHPWAESTLPTRHHCNRPKNHGEKVKKNSRVWCKPWILNWWGSFGKSFTSNVCSNWLSISMSNSFWNCPFSNLKI